MVCRCSRTETRGFSLVEALVAVVAGAMLLALGFGVLRSGARIQARAGSKLAATGEAELVFRKLARDLSAAVRPPRIEGNEIVIATSASPAVTWTFTAAPGQASAVERRDETRCSRHLAGALTAVDLKELATGGRTTLALALTAQGPQDAVPAEFRETYFLRGPLADSGWNPIH